MTKPTFRPATPLPWEPDCLDANSTDMGNAPEYGAWPKDKSVDRAWDLVFGLSNIENATYIVHACNAYPRLVEVIRAVAHGDVLNTPSARSLSQRTQGRGLMTIEVFLDDVNDLSDDNDDLCIWVVAELDEKNTLLNVIGKFASLFEAKYYAATYRERSQNNARYIFKGDDAA